VRDPLGLVRQRLHLGPVEHDLGELPRRIEGPLGQDRDARGVILEQVVVAIGPRYQQQIGGRGVGDGDFRGG
jgi:hypothetical protein